MRKRLRELMCVWWFGGHQEMVCHQRGRIFLKCVGCGRETPGWQVLGTRG